MFSIFKKKATFVPKKYVLFNVDTFNEWFNDRDNGAVYAHSGIYLRLDKLSVSHIEDYLVKCHNLTLEDWDLHDEVREFHDRIRFDWIKQIGIRENQKD